MVDIILVSSLMTLFIAVVSSYLTYRWGLLGQIRISNYQNQQKAYSKLIGQRAIISQLYVSRFEAYIFSDFHEIKWKLNGSPKDSIDFQETLRWMKKSEDLGIELAREKKELFETVGLLNALFPQTKELKKLSSQVYHHKLPEIKRLSQGRSFEELETWKVTTIKQLQDFVKKNITNPMEDLGNYIYEQLP